MFCGLTESRNVGVCYGGLDSLFIRGTKVTTRGVNEAVGNLKKLKQLDYDAELRACVPANIVRPMTHMTSFICNVTGTLTIEKYALLPNGALHQRRRTETNVYTHELANMLDISSTLTMRRYMRPLFSYISFRMGIVPFLRRFGSLLRNISLDNISDIDIFFITSTCPLVQSITLQGCSFRDPGASLIPLPARNIPPSFIENIIYDSTLGGWVSSLELLHLLLSPKLTDISFNCCSTLNDEVLYRAFNSHRFKHLKRLSLNFCDNISNEAFKSVFLVESNVLQFVEIVGCRQLSKPHVRAQWIDLTTRKNWDVKFVFFFREKRPLFN